MIRLIVEPEAEDDIADAYDWYERHAAGLGDRFLNAVRECVARVQQNPQAYPIVEAAFGVRCCGPFPMRCCT